MSKFFFLVGSVPQGIETQLKGRRNNVFTNTAW